MGQIAQTHRKRERKEEESELMIRSTVNLLRRFGGQTWKAARLLAIKLGN